MRIIVHVLLLPVLLSAGAGSVEAKDKFVQRGLASWYGTQLNGKATASGEPMDRQRLTAAHRTLPFGTVLDVTNKKNGRRVRVTVNDRGPGVENRVIDLSPVAAAQLGMKKKGLAPVEIRQARWE
jgi:peptidoglycan lytic transglycosylase